MGGGLAVSKARLIATDASFVGNGEGQGGGLAASNAGLAATNVAFVGNRAGGEGGGVSLAELGRDVNGPVSFTNAAFSGNGAGGSGGGVYAGWRGGQGTLDLINATFAGNKSGSGGGMFNVSDDYGDTPGVVTVQNTIFWANLDSFGGAFASLTTIGGAGNSPPR